MTTFYVCSYGGSGSKMLCNALSKYGNVEHIHYRNPPLELEYIGNKNGVKCYREWFNGVKIPKDELHKYTVIYIYRNPVASILSRFYIPEHLEHVQVDKNIKLQDVLNEKKDLYGITEFYNNYTESKKRNYPIYCIKYEDIFNKQNEISKILNVGPLNLSNKSTAERRNHELEYIYKDLIDKMSKNPSIFIS